MTDNVVLIDEKNNVLGTTPKENVHTNNTQLHRGFSLFLFNKNKELLLQQRSNKKKTWPGVWSNSVCGHPQLGESVEDAAKRRLTDELHMQAENIQIICPDYRYRVEKDGVVENEICPILVGIASSEPAPQDSEVANIRWVPWGKWLEVIQKTPEEYSPWCSEETALLKEQEKFQTFLQTI